MNNDVVLGIFDLSRDLAIFRDYCPRVLYNTLPFLILLQVLILSLIHFLFLMGLLYHVKIRVSI